MNRQEFKAKIERFEGVGTWTCMTVPFSVEKAFGIAGQVRVKGTINGAAFNGALLPHGDGRHYLVVNKTIRDAARIAVGDTVKATMEIDNAKREVVIPADFEGAISENEGAASFFATLAYSHKKAYIDWIESAKRAETRQDRIGKSIEKLQQKQSLR